MAKSKVLVKVSGDLLTDQGGTITKWIRSLVADHSVTILTGGGRQINNHFKRRGWVREFGLLGRRTNFLRQRQGRARYP